MEQIVQIALIVGILGVILFGVIVIGVAVYEERHRRKNR